MLKKSGLNVNNLSPKFKYVWDKLEDQIWFRRTSLLVKTKLADLKENFLGYLMNLSQKKALGKDKEIMEITSICHSKKYIITTFKTRSKLTNQIFEDEVVNLNEGEDKMNRGVVLLETKENGIKKLIFLKNGPILMYYPNFSNSKTVLLPAKTEKHLKDILGLDKITVKKYIDLGKIDPGLNIADDNSVNLFALILESGEKEIDGNEEIKVLDIDKVMDEIFDINNALILSIIIKLKALTIIK